MDERALLVANAKCCFFCLKKNHVVNDCMFAAAWMQRGCGVDDCKMRHHKMLYGSKRIKREVVTSDREKNTTEDPAA